MEGVSDVDQKFVESLNAKIEALGRKFHLLANQVVTAPDEAARDNLLNEMAAAKKEKDVLENLQQAPVRQAPIQQTTVQQKPRLIVTLRPSQQEAIDLTQDEITRAIKRERSVSPNASGLESKRSRTRRSRQQFSGQDFQQVAQDRPKPKTRRRTTATSTPPIDARKCVDFPVIAESHPTLVPSPDGPGAVELRCCVCGCNALARQYFTASRSLYFHGIRGLMRHFTRAHGTHKFGRGAVQAAAVIRGCTYDHVPQEVVDAIRSGDARAYTVPVISVTPRPARSLRAREGSGEVHSDDEEDVTVANGEATAASADEQHGTEDGHWPFRPMVP
ncbi:hypothetical protein KC349_g3451 [Hortaea werneckii]|nr:hypothetical protein KC349_g3451 [Hortaea werneckii]